MSASRSRENQNGMSQIFNVTSFNFILILAFSQCELCPLSSLLAVGGERMLCARAVPPEHPSQRTLRLPASCAMLCHGALGIVLTTPLSYAAVGFSWGQ